MDSCTLLSRLGSGEYVNKIHNIGNLKLDTEYPLKSLERKTTIYGVVIVAHLTEMSVFLPQRFSEMAEETIIDINEGPRLVLKYQGQMPIGGGKKMHKIEFLKKEGE